MNTLFLANAQSGASTNMWMMIVIIVIFGGMYFVMGRQQKKRQESRMQMMDKLKKGDRVILSDGLHGKIDSINTDDNTVVIDADGIYLTFNRMAVYKVLSSTNTGADSSAAESANSDAEKSAKETEENADSNSEE